MTTESEKSNNGCALVMIVLIIGVLYFFSRRTITVELGEAQHDVVMALQASDSKEVTATFTRYSGADHMKFVIPAGTLIRNADPGSQRLITARPITVVVSTGTPAVRTIETYCLDQFALEPHLGSSLSFVSNSALGQVEREETEPIQKLVQILAQSSEPHNRRQMAVWLVAGGYENLTYEAVYQKLRQESSREVEKEMAVKWDLARERLREKMPPNYPEAEIEAAVQRYKNSQWEEAKDALVEKNTKEALEDFAANGERILKSYDPNIGDKRFFVDVRARGSG